VPPASWLANTDNLDVSIWVSLSNPIIYYINCYLNILPTKVYINSQAIIGNY